MSETRAQHLDRLINEAVRLLKYEADDKITKSAFESLQEEVGELLEPTADEARDWKTDYLAERDARRNNLAWAYAMIGNLSRTVEELSRQLQDIYHTSVGKGESISCIGCTFKGTWDSVWAHIKTCPTHPLNLDKKVYLATPPADYGTLCGGTGPQSQSFRS